MDFDKLSADYADIVGRRQNYTDEIRKLREQNAEVLKQNSVLQKQLQGDRSRRAAARKKLGAIEKTITDIGIYGISVT